MSDDFPDTASSTLGRFWLPGASATEQVTGMIRVSGSRVELDVIPELTPWIVWDEHGRGQHAVDNTIEVIFGSLPIRPGPVTLWQTNTTDRTGVGFPGMSQATFQQSFRATWCLAGDHFTDPKMKFSGFRPEVTNLTEWGDLVALSQSLFPEQRHHLRWDLKLEDSLDAPLANGEGYLTLSPAASIRPMTARGLDITTYSVLEAELLDGWTLTESFESLTVPLTTLMTILSGERSGLRSMSAWSEDSGWVTVHGTYMEPDSPQTAGALLFRCHDVGLDFLSRWIAVHRRFSPVPQIVAASIAGEFETVDTEALSLATALEAFHRVLDPKARRFTEDEIDAARSELKVSGIPSGVKKSFDDALGQYWAEFSYPKRIEALAQPVFEAVPSVIGKLSKWKGAVVDQRISLAHGKAYESDPSDRLLRMSSLNRSIRWMLTIRLMLEAEVPAEVLAKATAESRQFQRDKNQWNRFWPRIFGAGS